MTNAWDFPIYGLIFGLVLCRKVISTAKIKTEQRFFNIFISGFIVLLMALATSLPFILNFKNIHNKNINIAVFKS